VQYLEGLQVMLLGMGLVFLSLVTIMFVMMGLQRAFPYRPDDEVAAVGGAEAVDATPGVTAVAPSRTAEGEVALAIALAVARARAAVPVGPSRGFATVAARSGEQAALRWDWLWDAGLDDYGTAKGSTDADFRSNC
jgi:Na+-transporting methylmalonyl-CoA/oxaloacetate decarboxylase gamma subunit